MVPGKLKELYYDINNKYRNTTTFTSSDSEYIFNDIILKKYLGIDPNSERANIIRSMKEYLSFDETKVLWSAYYIVLNMLNHTWPEYTHDTTVAWNTIIRPYATMVLFNLFKYKLTLDGKDTKEYTEYRKYLKEEVKNIRESERVSNS